MNVYDKARELVIEIKNTPEYQGYMAAKEKVSVNSELVAALNDYQEKQFELQKTQLSGEGLPPEMMAAVQELYQILAKDPLAAEYLQAQVRYLMMAGDLYKTLGEVLMI
ncbi:MAG: YlbF family regulator [Clostridiales Family XIII bacterium]|jgi:cell fate (sporulation/competence/biofilm development) regulator YlbF (YheA/YmcA/DUF963 family)|nr:YlbF family regulator [Clostridiales Family XIII bacterium]